MKITNVQESKIKYNLKSAYHCRRIMPFYKYFRKEEHMQSFIEGYVRFVNIAYYKHLEDKNKTRVLGDSREGSTLIDLSESSLRQNNVIFNLKGVSSLDGKQFDYNMTSDNGLVGLSLNVVPKDYANNWIFCVSMQESEKFRQDGYLYYVEFDESSFNGSFKFFFNGLEKKIIKNNRPFMMPKIGNDQFVLQPSISRKAYNESWYWHEKIHYADNSLSDLKKDPLFTKQKEFIDEHEYRYALYMDFFKICNPENVQSEFDERIKLLSSEEKNHLKSDLECIQLLESENTSMTFQLEKFIIHKCGKI